MNESALPPEPGVPPATPLNPLPTSRSAQVALAVFLAVLLGLLAFRGYGARLGARPTETVAVRFDLNRADRTELEQIPGVGPKMAQAIEQHRNERGPFRSVDELRDVKGVGPVTLDKLRPFVRVEPVALRASSPEPEPPALEYRRPSTAPKASPAPPPAHYPSVRKLRPGDPPIHVNTASADQLHLLPGIGTVTAQAIIAARADRPFRSVEDLDRVKGIGRKTLEKVRPFVVFD